MKHFYLFCLGFLGALGCGQASDTSLPTESTLAAANDNQCLAFRNSKAEIKYSHMFAWDVDVELKDLDKLSQFPKNPDYPDCAKGAYQTQCIRDRYNPCYFVDSKSCREMKCDNNDCSNYTQICFYQSDDAYEKNAFLQVYKQRLDKQIWSSFIEEEGVCCGPEADRKKCIYYPRSIGEPLIYANRQDNVCEKPNRKNMKCTRFIKDSELRNPRNQTIRLWLQSASTGLFFGAVANAGTAQQICWDDTPGIQTGIRGKRVVLQFKN